MEEKNIWEMKNKAELEVVVIGLKDALSSSDVEGVITLLRDAKNLRSLVVIRGEGSVNLRLLLKCFDFVFEKELGDSFGFMGIKNEDVLPLLHRLGIPEQIVVEINDIAYHLRDKELFEKSSQLILEHAGVLLNKQLFVRTIHNQATWTDNVEAQPERAIEINKSILGQVRALGDRALEQKIKFGIKVAKIKLNKNSIPLLELAKDFEEMAAIFEVEHIGYNAAYSWAEAARAYFVLAVRQANDTARNQEFHSNLEKAKQLALKAVAKAKELEYNNLEVVAQELMGLICRFQDEKRSALKFLEKADMARIAYNYHTKAEYLQIEKA